MNDLIHDQRDWLEPVAAVIMSVATVLIAWSAYQNTSWAGEVGALGRQASAARTESAKDLARLNQDLIGDQVLFSSYILASTSGNEMAAEAIAAEFRPDFASLVSEWAEGGSDSPSPFDSDEYTVRDEMAATIEHTLQAESAADAATIATEVRNDYAAATVIFAMVLFVVGIGKTFKTRSIRVGSLVVGGSLVILALVWETGLPVVL